MTESKEVPSLGPAIPLVAIVGRPNVGKSTLFNRIVGSRRAIVHERAGMTRDRLVAQASWQGTRFQVSDTGGIDPGCAAGLSRDVQAQALRAASSAAVVIVVVDGRAGLLPDDAELVRALRRIRSEGMLLAANKLDAAHLESLAAEFASIGLGAPHAVSAEHGLGVAELLDAVVALLPSAPQASREEERPIGVALVGRPNVGKSTLFNRLVAQERSIVSELPGTTRDSVDIVVRRDGLTLRFVDTPGIRRPGRTEQGPEVLSVVLAKKSIARADVAVLILDATRPVAHQDAVVAGIAEQYGKATVVVATKWDLVQAPEERKRELAGELARELKFLHYAPLLTVSGKTGRGVDRLASLLPRLDEASARRIPTARLNRFVETRLADLALSAPGASSGQILYGTQVSVRPPSFLFFTSRRVSAHFSSLRHIQNRLREEFGFEGCPIRVRLRARRQRRQGSHG